jgi:hypothetical protein
MAKKSNTEVAQELHGGRLRRISGELTYLLENIDFEVLLRMHTVAIQNLSCILFGMGCLRA